jgi:phage baseplate assembly protein W
MANKNYSPKLPLQVDSTGNFVNISDIMVNIKQKLRFIVLTNPGEKIMDPAFGAGVKRFLFQNPKEKYFNNNSGNGLNIQEQVKTSIIRQVEKYCSEVKIYDVQTKIEEQVLFITVFYNFNNILEDFLEVRVQG